MWTDIKPGSPYGALGRMAADGLIEVVCTQQEGNLPEGTIYRITDKGRRELVALRQGIIRDTRTRPDPLDLALAYSGGMDTGELREMIVDRRRALIEELASWQALQKEATPHLTGLEPLTFQHALVRLRAEIDWHESLIDHLKGNS